MIHTASPFPSIVPKDENELIRPARKGTLRVLRNVKKAGIRRLSDVVNRSDQSMVRGRAPFTESDWTDVDGSLATPYYKSKTLAERAAWEFAGENDLELVVINPGMILVPHSRQGFRRLRLGW